MASRKRKSPSPAPRTRRACILTGGGDAPGLNAVIRAFVKTSVDLGVEVVGSLDGFAGLIEPDRLVPLDKRAVRGILPRGGSILGCNNRANPFAYPQRGARGQLLKRTKDLSYDVVDRLKKEKIDTLVVVGGDGTMWMGMQFLERGVPVVGIPKTIDNDLAATDVTFGLDTAVKTATWAIDTLHSTAETHHRVMIVELMGRYAGWISLQAGIAGGADVVLIPEMPYDLGRVVAKLHERDARGASFSIVVVGEGARQKGGTHAQLTAGQKGHLPRLGGAGQQLADMLAPKIDSEIRVTVLGHLQRGGSPSNFDRLLGTRYGVKAAQLVAAGDSGKLVALRGTEVAAVPIAEATAAPKLVDPNGELVATARAVGIELGA